MQPGYPIGPIVDQNPLYLYLSCERGQPMAGTKLLVACIMLGLCALALAQLEPNMDADIQKHHGHKKDTYKEKTYKKDDYEEKEYKEDPEDSYFKKKDYHKSTPPSPSPPPPPPPPSPKYSYDDQYDSYKPSGPKTYNGYKDYDRYEYPRTQYPGGPRDDYKPKDDYKPRDDYKPYPSPPPPVVAPPKYYPDSEYPDSYGSGGYHPKDIAFTLKESVTSTINPSLAMPPIGQLGPPTLGSLSTRSASLLGEVDGVPTTVGTVGWTGITYSTVPNAVMVNWQLSIVIFQDDWEGKIIAAGPNTLQTDTSHPKEWPVLGGSGMFEGATGTVTWLPGTPNLYKLELTLWPHKKRHYGSYAAIASLPAGLPSSSRRR